MPQTVNTVHQHSITNDLVFTRRVIAIGCVVIALLGLVLGLLL